MDAFEELTPLEVELICFDLMDEHLNQFFSNSHSNDRHLSNDVIPVSFIEPIQNTRMPMAPLANLNMQTLHVPTVIDYIDLSSPKRENTYYNTSQVNAKPEENSENKDISCRICFESLFNRVTMSTECGHMFCKSCLDLVLKAQKKCPTCKRSISEKQIFRIYF